MRDEGSRQGELISSLIPLSPASVGVLGFEHDRRDQPVIRPWNYISEPRE
jgi:hypothetical protein